MQIHIHLHGALRDKLPPENKGRIILSVAEETAVSTILAQFSLQHHIQVAINQEIIENNDIILQDGDQVEVFRPAAGG
ncbi:MAG: MoaD/ThiS family protein [Chloroflexi bacterium]|nr:MoaD/ThiS family protein [Chloroflexota bacterium]